MFSVIFEAQLEAARVDAHLDQVARLQPDYEKVRGFIGNSLFRSLRRPPTILSLSKWQDEKSLVRWRVHESHHRVQQAARAQVLTDYRLRVGQVTRDMALGDRLPMVNQRLDETAAGNGITITLISGQNDPTWVEVLTAQETATWLGFDPTEEQDCVEWDVYQEHDSPQELLLLTAWRSHRAADAFSAIGLRPECSRYQRIRVIRDYGMYDRREAPQYFPDMADRPIHHA